MGFARAQGGFVG